MIRKLDRELLEAVIGLTLAGALIIVFLYGITWPFSYIDREDYLEIRAIYKENKPETNQEIDRLLAGGRVMNFDFFSLKQLRQKEQQEIENRKIVYGK